MKITCWVFYDENLIDLFPCSFFIYDDTELCDGMSAMVFAFCSSV